MVFIRFAWHINLDFVLANRLTTKPMDFYFNFAQTGRWWHQWILFIPLLLLLILGRRQHFHFKHNRFADSRWIIRQIKWRHQSKCRICIFTYSLLCLVQWLRVLTLSQNSILFSSIQGTFVHKQISNGILKQIFVESRIPFKTERNFLVSSIH